MKITKGAKYLPDQLNQSTNQGHNHFIISSDLSIQSLYNILTKTPQLINKVDKFGETFLSYAIKRRKIDVCQFLLTSPVLDLSYKDQKGNSYLHLAYITKCDEVISSLIEKGADESCLNNDGLTPSEVDKAQYQNQSAFLLSTSDELNKSLKMDWSERNLLSNNNQVNQSTINKKPCQIYAKSFIDHGCSRNKVLSARNSCSKTISFGTQNNVSTETRYQSNQCKTVHNNVQNTPSLNENEESDLFDLSSSYGTLKREKNNENDEDIVNVKFSRCGTKNDDTGSKINFDLTLERKINNDKVLPLSQAETQKNIFEINTEQNGSGDYQKKNTFSDTANTIKEIPCDLGDNFLFSSPHIQEITPANDKEEVKNSNEPKEIKNEEKVQDDSKDKPKEDLDIPEPISDEQVPKPSGYQDHSGLYKKSTEIKTDILESLNINVDNNPSPLPAMCKKSETSSPSKSNQNTERDCAPEVQDKSMYNLLKSINLEKYYPNLHSNGFDDISLIVDQTKTGIGITDQNLKDAGIIFPGERAKILIRIQQEAKNFPFEVPKSVYHVCENTPERLLDPYVQKLNGWLKELKVDQYLENFLNNGYMSLELLLMQMESKSPLTDDILQNEIGIEKLGYRARILNKLKNEGRSLNNKLKTSLLIIDNKGNNNICECVVF